MNIPVIRTSRGLVQPFQQTPSGLLDLSGIDQIPALRCFARTLHVYIRHGGPEAANVIREALSKALVEYYPLAGRLKESTQGRLQVDCSGEGTWFVEASADCTLESVHFLDDYLSIPFDLLLPDEVPETETEPLVQMQVTEFACGGFVIGLSFCHTICDGLGSAQFLNAVGELARGYPLSVTPTWHRNFSPIHPTNTSAAVPISLPPIPDYKLEHANTDIPMDEIKRIKQHFHESTGRTCSTFEIVAAIAWRGRTRAIDLSPGTEVKLVFFANCRKILDPPLPDGFYGNCFFPVTISGASGSVIEASVLGVIELIQEAKAKLPTEFAGYMKGEHSGDPFGPPLGYKTLFISEWGRLGFNNVDFGWGPPVHVVPIQGSGIIPVGIVGWQPLPRKGVRLMTWCVKEAHYGSFIHQMNSGKSATGMKHPSIESRINIYGRQMDL